MLVKDTRHPESPFFLKGGRTKTNKQTNKKPKTNKQKKTETKDLGTETYSGEGVVKEKFLRSRKPSHRWVFGEFWNLRGQHNLHHQFLGQGLGLNALGQSKGANVR